VIDWARLFNGQTVIDMATPQSVTFDRHDTPAAVRATKRHGWFWTQNSGGITKRCNRLILIRPGQDAPCIKKQAEQIERYPRC
jgi:hypothetical protein